MTIFYSPNNTYNVIINGVSDKTGSLLEDFEPPVNPPKEIDDPEDKKPSTWVDEKQIPDPAATKVSILIIFPRTCQSKFMYFSLMTGMRTHRTKFLMRKLLNLKAGSMTNLLRSLIPVSIIPSTPK
jgi:hypothetical protein